ncbi:egl nine homolog 1-like, partial [Saccostrea cucullata]|uniref:egl nine homolog 1-like n=1 Tax=Saccostrea cuccullata TaxID=36930 RepID=UPI002ED5EC9A
MVCGSKENLKRCTRCKGVVYCCRQHQIQDWPSHKLSCSPNQAIDTVTNSKLKVNKQTAEKDTCLRNGNNDSVNKSGATNNDFIEFDSNPFKEINFKKPLSSEGSKLAEFVLHYLNKNNFCIVDGIFSDTHLRKVLEEIKILNAEGCLKLGRLSGGRTSAQESLKMTKIEIRNDTIYWAEGTESRHHNINKVVQKMDSVLSTLNCYFDGKYFINGRTKVMIACYPGNGSYYRRHVDNPSGDGRVITCILYLNRDWRPK